MLIGCSKCTFNSDHSLPEYQLFCFYFPIHWKWYNLLDCTYGVFHCFSIFFCHSPSLWSGFSFVYDKAHCSTSVLAGFIAAPRSNVILTKTPLNSVWNETIRVTVMYRCALSYPYEKQRDRERVDEIRVKSGGERLSVDEESWTCLRDGRYESGYQRWNFD